MTIAEANRLDELRFVAAFGAVFEGSPQFTQRAAGARPFESFEDLSQTFREAMYAAPRREQMALILTHPDLAGKAAVAGELSEESAGEQASAGLDRLSPEEYEAFTAANAAYREEFGFPMIFCIREHTKESILKGAEVRLENSPKEEFETALAEISKIADLRLRDLIEKGKTGP